MKCTTPFQNKTPAQSCLLPYPDIVLPQMGLDFNLSPQLMLNIVFLKLGFKQNLKAIQTFQILL